MPEERDGRTTEQPRKEKSAKDRRNDEAVQEAIRKLDDLLPDVDDQAELRALVRLGSATRLQKAVRNLGRFPRAYVVEQVVQATAHPRAETRKAAEETLKLMADADRMVELIDLVPILPGKPQNRALAAITGTRRAADAVGDKVTDDPRVRQATAAALRRMTLKPRNVDAARRLLKAVPPADDDLLTALVEKLGSPHKSAREFAAQFLGEHGSERTVEPLCQALKDDSAKVRRAAARSLGRQQAGSAREALYLALQDRDVLTAGTAAWAMGVLGDVRGAGRLVEMLARPEAELREWASEALLQMPEAAAAAIREYGGRAEEPSREFIEGLVGFSAGAVDRLTAAFGMRYFVFRAAVANLLAEGAGRKRPGAFCCMLRCLDTGLGRLPIRRDGSRRTDRSSLVEKLAVQRRKGFVDGRAVCYAAFDTLVEMDDLVIQPLSELCRSGDFWTYAPTFAAMRPILKANRPFLRAWPHLLCRRCLLRGERRLLDVDAFGRKPYVACRGCGRARHLVRNVRTVVGTIGAGFDAVRQEGGTLYVPVWDDAQKQVRNADLDVIEVRDERPENVDYAVNALWAHLTGDASRPRESWQGLEVRIKGDPPLSENARRILEGEFGPVHAQSGDSR